MRRPKIVQIESFYSQFLDIFYKKNTALKNAPFRSQINVLLDSEFSGGHNVVPYLNAQEWETHYIVSNCVSSQSKWAEENHIDLATATLRSILEAQLIEIQPDIVYLSDIPSFDFDILTRLVKKPFVIGWHATIVFEKIQWGQFDIVLSGIRHIRERVCELGAKKAVRFMPAAPHYRNSPQRPTDEVQDLVFSGSFVGSIHTERALQYRELSRRIGCNQLHIYTPAPFQISATDQVQFHPPVFGKEVLDLYSKARIVLDSRGDFNLGEATLAQRETSNMRVFEATRAGAMLLMENCQNIDDYFTRDIEVICFDSTDELIDKVNYFLSPKNDNQRRKIANAGLSRTVSEHLIEHRAKWFERILRDEFFPEFRNNGRHVGDTSFSNDIFCTSVSSENVLFGIHLIKSVIDAFPNQPLAVLCRDEAVHELMNALSLRISILRMDDLFTGNESIVPEHLNEMNESSLTAHLLQTLLKRYRQTRRATYIDPSIQLLDRDALHFSKNDDSVYLLDYQFGPDFAYESEIIGSRTLSLVSVPNGQVGDSFLAELMEIAGNSQVASERTDKAKSDDLGVASAIQEFERKGKQVKRISTCAPWNFSYTHTDNGIGKHRLFLFVLIGRKKNGTYELLPFSALPSWNECYRTMYVPYFLALEKLNAECLANYPIGDQVSGNADAQLSTLMLQRCQLGKYGYRLLTTTEYSRFGPTNTARDIATAEYRAFELRLARHMDGNQSADFLALANILSKIVQREGRILEISCGSGFHFALIRDQILADAIYSGVDNSSFIIELATEHFPHESFHAMQPTRLEFDDRSFDVVVDNSSLIHERNLHQAVAEASRVAASFVVFHSVMITRGKNNLFLEKSTYESPVSAICFSEAILAQALANHRLQPIILETEINIGLEAATGHEIRSVSIGCLKLQVPDPKNKVPENFNYYCLYFDSNYLPRALLTIESLTRHDPRAYFFVLCLDDVTESFIKSYAPNVKSISVAELEAADPDFATARNNRTLIEWYFTATSVLPHYLFVRFPNLNRVTYIDSDLYFYTSPAILHEESKGKSVQIIEHRFSPHLVSLARYGRFNVAWISFFNSVEGRHVVDDYRRECLEWCYDRLEDDKFADQKYLDKWPERYPNCCISRWIGADVAHWNIGQWDVSYFNQDIYVNSERLLFYHFQGVKRIDSGEYTAGNDPKTFGIYYDLIYRSYLDELTKMEARLSDTLKAAERKQIRHVK